LLKVKQKALQTRLDAQNNIRKLDYSMLTPAEQCLKKEFADLQLGPDVKIEFHSPSSKMKFDVILKIQE